MGNPRDNQRQRVYDAENAAAHAVGQSIWGQSIPNDKVQDWVDDVLAKGPIFNRWPNKKIKVVLSRGGGHADHWGTKITLGAKARNPWFILHEVAHCLLPGDRYAFHGPEYAGVLAFLVKTVLGKEAHTALLAEYRTKRVRRSAVGIPKPQVGAKTRAVAKKRAAAARPPTATELREAAEVIRQAAKAGLLGPGTAKPRVHALATARALEGVAVPKGVAA